MPLLARTASPDRTAALPGLVLCPRLSRLPLRLRGCLGPARPGVQLLPPCVCFIQGACDLSMKLGGGMRSTVWGATRERLA